MTSTSFNILDNYHKNNIQSINNCDKNIPIKVPIGHGKSYLITNILKDKLKYLILVPSISGIDSLKNNIINHKPDLKDKIQILYDKLDPNKDICICVFNKVNIIKNECQHFEKIFVDEAYRIYENGTNDERSYIKIIKDFANYDNNVYLI